LSILTLFHRPTNRPNTPHWFSMETLYAHPGAVMFIELAENPTTGYLWEVESCSRGLVVESEYIPSDGGHRPPRPAVGPVPVGGAGTRRFALCAGTPGRRGLVLVLRRPWLKEAPLSRREYDLVTEPI
jgi:predicted secreted protein